LTDYRFVCGEVFEDLSYSEVLDYNGGAGISCTIMSVPVSIVTLLASPRRRTSSEYLWASDMADPYAYASMCKDSAGISKSGAE
jgi:hypothetical protein